MKSCLGIDSALLSIYSGKSLELTTFEKQYQRHCLENNHITKVIKQSCPRGTLSLCLLSSSPQVALPMVFTLGLCEVMCSGMIPVQFSTDPCQWEGVRQMGFLSLACVILAPTHPPLLLHPSAVWEGLRVLGATSHLCLLWGSLFLWPGAWQAPGLEPQENLTYCVIRRVDHSVVVVPKTLIPKIRRMN